MTKIPNFNSDKNPFYFGVLNTNLHLYLFNYANQEILLEVMNYATYFINQPQKMIFEGNDIKAKSIYDLEFICTFNDSVGKFNLNISELSTSDEQY